MKKTYICIRVYDDGDNELTKLELNSSEVSCKLFEGTLCFDIDHDVDKLTLELLDYGNEPKDVKEAVTYILNQPVGDSCIVGKV
jgi:hypothetical protein